MTNSSFTRVRHALLFATLAASATAVSAAQTIMYRDPGCGCCEQWAAHIEKRLKHNVITRNEPNMTARKDAKGVPDALRSCHTAIVDGYIIEGHVPARDIARLIKTRPAGVKGLAVAGMPLGSPGMEMGGSKQPYQVMAFGNGKPRVFASYD